MNKTNKCEEGVMISRGTFRDYGVSVMNERIDEVVHNSKDPLISTLMALEFSIMLGDLEKAIFGKENK